MADTLTADEIKFMRDYLNKFPPHNRPVNDLRVFDVLRICATLEAFEANERNLFDQLFESGQELSNLRGSVARGHDSHNCPNGTSPDGHCDACMDKYWQTKGPELQKQVFALEQELACLRMWLVTFHEFMKTAPPAQREFGPSPVSKAYMNEFLNASGEPKENEHE